MPERSCELCGRDGLKLTRHHLVPRKMHNKARIRKKWTREELRTRVAWLCRSCHNQVHAVLTEKELADTYHSLEALRDHPEIAKYAEWARTRKPRGRVSVRRKG